MLLDATENATLVALDADKDNLETAKQRLSRFGDRCTYIRENFIHLPELSLGMIDVIFADLGVSSPHFDDASRGFSFREDGPLDMRFNRSSGITAAQLIADLPEQDISTLLGEFGEVRQRNSIAKALKDAAPQTTHQAFAAIESVAGFRTKSIAPQVFQALRIAVNDELQALQVLLEYAPSMLNSGGRLGIISFHSLEDRLVKQCFRELTTVEKDETTGADIGVAPFELVQRKAIQPTDAEVHKNPRSRSARLRVLTKR